jgi:hypothetical protein
VQKEKEVNKTETKHAGMLDRQNTEEHNTEKKNYRHCFITLQNNFMYKYFHQDG